MSKLIFSQINKSYFILNPRRDDELVVLPQRGGATKELNKIALPFGRIDFDQFLRCSSEMWVTPQFLPRALNLIQNQFFNLVRILV